MLLGMEVWMFGASEYVFSWVKVYKAKPKRKEYPKSVRELQLLLRKLKADKQKYNFIGSAHSYNGIQCVDDNVAIIFDGRSLKGIEYDYIKQEVTVQCGVTIEKLKRFLLPLGRQLLSSGNYMKQKVVGALLTGTHGYGPHDAIMADSIASLQLMDEDGNLHVVNDEEVLKYLRVSFGAIGLVVSMTLRTKALEQFDAEQTLFPLSKLKERLSESGNSFHALTLFPYSDREDPSIGFARLRKLEMYTLPQKVERKNALISFLSWILIKILRFVDEHARQLRVPLQRLVKHFEGRYKERVITSPTDIDYLYDYYPLMESERNPGILRQFYTPTYTSYNIAVVIPRDQLIDLLRYISQLAYESLEKKPPQYFKNTIGARYVASSSKCAMAGNYERDSYSVDLFFDTDRADFAESVQDDLARRFAVRPHWGKSILKSYMLDNIDAKVIHHFKLLRSKFSKANLLRPNLRELVSLFDQDKL